MSVGQYFPEIGCKYPSGVFGSCLAGDQANMYPGSCGAGYSEHKSGSGECKSGSGEHKSKYGEHKSGYDKHKSGYGEHNPDMVDTNPDTVNTNLIVQNESG